MRKCLFMVLSLIFFHPVLASVKDSTVYYNLPDSVKAVQFMAEVSVSAISDKRYTFTGIKTDAVNLSLKNYKGKRRISFSFPAYSKIITRGVNVRSNIRVADMELKYDWSVNETYKLLIAAATDSAENFSLYSGYIWLPRENKWKLLGTCKIAGRWTAIQSPALYFSTGKKSGIQTTTGQVWCQRSNGSWRNMNGDSLPSPTVNLFNHVDSVQQRQTDIKFIEDAISAGKTDAKQNEQGVYYTMMKEGTGRQVSVNDTVVAHYKGYLFADGSVFDQTKDKPATFPLKRLIRGWQVAVPLCKVGGKIKIVIPSDMAYSIRTRAAKIPPNSILVFEVEIMDARPAL